MSTVDQRSRQPRGVSIGGQFTAESRAEARAVVLDRSPDWGQLDVREGARTPWGRADYVSELGPGVVTVGTPGHGGIKLSPARNRAVPAELRNASGWYEEDCEVHIVAFAHPDLGIESPDDAAAGVRNWFPDGYEKATGETIAPGESWEKDERLWREAHADDLVTVSANTSSEYPGMVEVTATCGGARSQAEFDAARTFLVPQDEYRAGTSGRHPMVLDPDRYAEITKPKAPKTALPKYTGLSLESLTPAQQDRARAALGKRWQTNTGKVRTLEQLINEEGVSGKSASVNDGRRSYYLVQRQHAEDSSYSVLPVPKAVWDAVEAPDVRTPRALAREALNLAEHAALKVRERGGSISARADAQRKVPAARAAYEATPDR